MILKHRFRIIRNIPLSALLIGLVAAWFHMAVPTACEAGYCCDSETEQTADHNEDAETDTCPDNCPCVKMCALNFCLTPLPFERGDYAFASPVDFFLAPPTPSDHIDDIAQPPRNRG